MPAPTARPVANPETKGRADQEQRHRAELQRDDEAESESDGGRVHQCTVKDITG